ncbi:MAG: dihydroneopterin aldolase [Actinomycetia bacterium]|jgi:dihydroneopterin aldolase|nr:dihydroneopterin aldolase [Actinomycetes bacterium]
MPDRLRMVGARFWARHGALSREAVTPQPFEVDVELELDLGPAGRTDRLDLTVDYGALWQAVHEVMAGPRRRLLETLAEAIADRLLQPPVEQVRVTVRKLEPPLPGYVAYTAAEVVRTRARVSEPGRQPR